jgi:hypothetical protein
VWIVLLALICSPRLARGGDPAVELSGTSAEDLGRKLDTTIDGSLGFWESRMLLQSVGRSGRREQIPKLKVIAETQWGPERRSVIFHALYGLMLLGESSEYFLTCAGGFRTNFPLAESAMWVLAYKPTQEIIDRMSSIYSAAGGPGPLAGPFSTARCLLDLSQRYAEMTAVDEKVACLVPRVMKGWSLIGVDSFDYQGGGLNPFSVWAKKELLRLSQQRPAAVAAYVRAFSRIERGPQNEDYFVRRGPEVAQWNEQARQYILEYVSEETRAEYERLRKAEEQAPKPGEPAPPAP